MTSDSEDPRYVDALSLRDVDTYVYETVATLEYTGRPATREQIAAVTDLDDQVLGEALETLTRRGLLARSPDQDSPDQDSADKHSGEAFVPAQRGWSTAPEQGRGM